MSIAVIVLNVVFSVSVIVGIIGLLLWGIATQRGDHPARQALNAPRPTRAERRFRPAPARAAAVA